MQFLPLHIIDFGERSSREQIYYNIVPPPQITEEVFHFQEQLFSEGEISPFMQKAGGSNDMIALVWFVSRFFVTKAFGRASPPAFSLGFNVSMFILRTN